MFIKKLVCLVIVVILTLSHGNAQILPISRFQTDYKGVVLTFENLGPPEMVYNVLNALDTADVKAVFFISGKYAEQYPQVVRRINEMEHEIGNNAYSRTDLTQMTPQDILEEITYTHNVLVELGVTPTLIRPPRSAYNQQVLDVITQAGYDQVVLFDINPRDWSPDVSAAQIADTIISNSIGGSIVSLTAYQDTDIENWLQETVVGLKKKGFIVTTLSDLQRRHLEPPPPSIQKLNKINLGVLFGRKDYPTLSCQVLESIETDRKSMAVTFENLGEPHVVYNILEALSQADIKALFFISGVYAQKYPEVVKEIAARGHEVGNNGYSRNDFSEMSLEQIFREIYDTHEILEKLTGTPPVYIRTPRGNMMNGDIALAAAGNGYKSVVYYNINTRDWADDIQVEQISNTIIENANSGGIVTFTAFKDGRHMEVIRDAIADFSHKLTQMEYEIVSFSELYSQKNDDRKSMQYINGELARVSPNYNESTEVSDAITLLNTYKPDTIFNVRKNLRNPADYQENLNYKETGIPSEDGTKRISLTFDDYGTYDYVKNILDVLDLYDIKSTIFVTGRGVAHNPDTVRLIVARGHEVANHTFSHPHLSELSFEEVQNEVIEAHRKIAIATGENSVFFREPYGSVNEMVKQAIYACGYDWVAYSRDLIVNDWRLAPAEDIANSLIEGARDGLIPTLHINDGYNTAEGLKIAIPKLLEMGYKFVPLYEMFGLEKGSGYSED